MCLEIWNKQGQFHERSFHSFKHKAGNNDIETDNDVRPWHTSLVEISLTSAMHHWARVFLFARVQKLHTSHLYGDSCSNMTGAYDKPKLEKIFTLNSTDIFRFDSFRESIKQNMLVLN